jgi:hypothetical protein
MATPETSSRRPHQGDRRRRRLIGATAAGRRSGCPSPVHGGEVGRPGRQRDSRRFENGRWSGRRPPARLDRFAGKRGRTCPAGRCSHAPIRAALPVRMARLGHRPFRHVRMPLMLRDRHGCVPRTLVAGECQVRSTEGSGCGAQRRRTPLALRDRAERRCDSPQMSAKPARDVPLGVVAHRRLATGYQREACAVDVEVRVPPSLTRISAGADLDQRNPEAGRDIIRHRPRATAIRHPPLRQRDVRRAQSATIRATPLGMVVRSGDRSAGRALS